MSTIDQVIAAHGQLQVAIEDFEQANKLRNAKLPFGFSFAMEEAADDTAGEAKQTLLQRFKAFLSRIVAWFKNLFKKQQESSTDPKSIAEDIKKGQENLHNKHQEVQEAFKKAMDGATSPAKTTGEKSVMGQFVQGDLANQLADWLRSKSKSTLEDALSDFMVGQINREPVLLSGFNRGMQNAQNNGFEEAIQTFARFYGDLNSYLSSFDRALSSGNLTGIKAPNLEVPDMSYEGGNTPLQAKDYLKIKDTLKKQTQKAIQLVLNSKLTEDAHNSIALLEKLESVEAPEGLQDPDGAFREFMGFVTGKMVPFRNALNKFQAGMGEAVAKTTKVDRALLEAGEKAFASKREELKAEAQKFFESKPAFVYDEEALNLALKKLHTEMYKGAMSSLVG